MRFHRYPRGTEYDATPRRIAATARKLQRERDAVALFPELHPTDTVESRMEKIRAGRAEWWQAMRDRQAAAWRAARRDYQAMPALSRKGIFLYWQRCGFPGDPLYFHGLIRDAIRGRSGWSRLVELRRFELIGTGKLPWRL